MKSLLLFFSSSAITYCENFGCRSVQTATTRSTACIYLIWLLHFRFFLCSGSDLNSASGKVTRFWGGFGYVTKRYQNLTGRLVDTTWVTPTVICILEVGFLLEFCIGSGDYILSFYLFAAGWIFIKILIWNQVTRFWTVSNRVRYV